MLAWQAAGALTTEESNELSRVSLLRAAFSVTVLTGRSRDLIERALWDRDRCAKSADISSLSSKSPSSAAVALVVIAGGRSTSVVLAHF